MEREDSSRYYNTPILSMRGVEILDIRKRKEFHLEDAVIHQVVEGDTLDSLAYRYYGDSKLDWVILEANKQHFSIFSIRSGDELVIPSEEEVREIHE